MGRGGGRGASCASPCDVYAELMDVWISEGKGGGGVQGRKILSMWLRGYGWVKKDGGPGLRVRGRGREGGRRGGGGSGSPDHSHAAHEPKEALMSLNP
eukprot:359436-Chlamydomonas_euryale.AAC.2